MGKTLWNLFLNAILVHRHRPALGLSRESGGHQAPSVCPLREEEGGKHLNIEATENRGFATPSDEEYKGDPVPPTDEQIKDCGWLRPLSNKEIFGICLLTRSGVLRSMKRYTDEVAALDQAARYLPDTPLMKRALEKNRQLALNLHSADRWDSLWNDLGNLSPSNGRPEVCEHFQNQRFQIQFSMNQSTNLAEIENEISALKEEMKASGHGQDDRRSWRHWQPAAIGQSAGFSFPPSRRRSNEEHHSAS